MVVDHQARLRARRPERLPVLGIKRGDAGAGDNPGQQHAAAQPQLGDLCHFGDGLVNVPEQDLAHSGAPFGGQRAEVRQPAIVCTQAGPPQFEVPGGTRWGSGQAALREERRHRIGEDDLSRNAIGVQFCVTTIAVPVVFGVRLAEVPERIHKRLGQAVELVSVLRLEILAVVEQVRPGVAVSRNNRVPVHGYARAGSGLGGVAGDGASWGSS
ncbi:hypothetical protein MSHO_58410 [Mycobacterium shottsii]|uniref:Uncharacterized protein n=1 Tax=Mycobacterium shottsii TaxID=133549 RepID=A0A7I7LKD1_9MYCO|nr:hypothetical protein MSHO_58410 [Mycobacterium shottsii]